LIAIIVFFIKLTPFLCSVCWVILYWLFIVAAVIQCSYAAYFFVRIFRLLGGQVISEAQLRPVSIIICAKNEAENLRKNLPLVLSQQYDNGSGKANYEVIVVNDASTDDTEEVLKELEMRYDNLWDVVVPHNAVRDLQGKKFALSKGVAHVAHDWLLLTDADCAPASDLWLQQMIAPLAKGKKIVAGYGGYHKAPGLLNAFIRWETMHTFLQYSTYSLAGMPYMAVGRNMACTKEILLQAQQSDLWNALPSGDDDLLIRIAGTGGNTAVVCNEAAFTYSDTNKSFKDWVGQKQRHLSTGKYYKEHIKLLLGGYGASHAIMWIGFLALLFTPFCEDIIVVMVARCLIYWIIWIFTAEKLMEKNLIYLFPFFDMGWTIYNFAFFPYITWKNKKHWK